MKKVGIFLIVLFFVAVTNSSAQTTAPTTPATKTATTADFFAAKWKISIIGVPGGDKEMLATITRKDGTLSCELSDPAEPDKEKMPATVEETDTKMTIAFSGGGYDVNIELEKVDDDNLAGKLMGMFETKAVRVK